MAKGFPGADSSDPVSASAGGKGMIELATGVFGQAPLFWGRYFTSPTTGGTVEYNHINENNTLAKNNIKLLPIARQTTHVAGSSAQGSSDATDNVDDLIQTFGINFLASQGSQFLMFLDVEGSSDTDPSLSVAYYQGWAETLVAHSKQLTNQRVTILPCVYGRQGDNTTWNALRTAAQQGLQCSGVWVARYYFSGCSMPDWDDQIIMPTVSLPCPVLLWQYQENCAQGMIDTNQTNPNVDINTLFLSKLVVPPMIA